jgi:transposase InsO family protein
MTDIKSASRNKGVPVTTLCQALMLPRASFYRRNINKPASTKVASAPVNSLSDEQRQTIMDLLHSERFVDCTPYQVYYTLLDEGQYYGSISTFYRLLAEQGETKPRREQRSHRDAIKPELMATAPNQVWSWDITKLLSVDRLVYYYLYVIMDIFSRYVVGWLIADRECQLLARELIQITTLKQGIQPNQLTLHADNGPSMTSHTVAQLLGHLGVLKTHNRPYTSNDNPFSESQFKTLKYCPQFPRKFNSIEHAEEFCQTFFNWYNKEHYHSGVLWLNPQTVHYGNAENILQKRHQTLLNAFDENPAKFNRRKPIMKKLQPVYINPPEINNSKLTLQQEAIMA